MPQRINANKPELWKADVAASVDQFNQWFLQFAPEAFKTTRAITTDHVKAALIATNDLRRLTPDILKDHPKSLSSLRMSTAPPLAVDRLIGLSGASKNLVGRMEKGELPRKMEGVAVESNLAAICRIIAQLLDADIFPWLATGQEPTERQRTRAATIIADQLCSAATDDILRWAWKQHQLAEVSVYLDSLGYVDCPHRTDQGFAVTPSDNYKFGVTVPLVMGKSDRETFDVLIQPQHALSDVASILINVPPSLNSRAARRAHCDAEAMKLRDLKMTYGDSVAYVLLLGGKFDPGYLGTLAAEGLDWVWQHRLDDLGYLVDKAPLSVGF